MKVVVFKDKNQLIKDIVFCLEVRYPGVEVLAVTDESKGIECIESESPDLIFLDSSLPKTYIVELVNKIRKFSGVPLIVMLETGTDFDRAKCLEAGADEYINVPFSPIDLLTRVNALLRRSRGLNLTGVADISAGNGLSINLSTHEVLLSSKSIKLTRIEFEILALLVKNKGKLVTTRTLLDKVWKSDNFNDESFIKKYIYRLRIKLESDPHNPKLIVNERGYGYLITNVLLGLLITFGCEIEMLFFSNIIASMI